MVYREHESAGYELLKSQAMAYLDLVKVGDKPGDYKKEECDTGASTYGAYHTTQILHLFGELQKMPKEDLRAWADKVNGWQVGKNGFFSNKPEDVNKTRTLREMDSVWHFTRGMIWTLRTLGMKPARSLEFVEPFLNKKVLYDTIKSYNWGNPWSSGNQVCGIATALMAVRDWENVPYVDELMEDAMFPAFEELLDKKTGYWGTQHGADLYNGAFGTVHVLPMYFAQGWEFTGAKENIDTTLSIQYPDGSYWPGGSDCPDFDGAYMLHNMFELSDYRADEVKEAARKYIEHAKMHISDDGVGFLLHRKDTDPSQWTSRPHYIWKDGDTDATEEFRDVDITREKLLLGSWFYPQSIALCTSIVEDSGFEGPYKLKRLSLHHCNVDVEPEL